MKQIKLIVFYIMLPMLGLAQEIITDLSVNFRKKELAGTHSTQKQDKSVYVLMPFVDDFSNQSIFPAPNLWANRFAFINNAYPINPPTIGVATLDALNDSGTIYNTANSSSFIADYLESNPVRLDSVMQGSNLVPVKVSDSLYLSFYYQPQGIGNKPEGHDSLVLEFFSPTDTMWYWIWSDAGQSYQNFKNLHGKDFRQIMIPVTDSLKFFHKEFKFRFYNYASIANTYEPSWAGNVDQWHLDYVYLNKGRTMSDTIYEDVAFSTTPQSLLTKYQSVPWPHYPGNVQMNTTEALPYINLSNITKNVSRNFTITDLSDNSEVFAYTGGNLNLPPFTVENFSAPVSYTFATAPADTALFVLKGIINTTPDINRSNDTVRFYQRFYNYYAYDDGTPEAGYGLTTPNAQLAYRFTTQITDTLKAVQMFFNQTFNNSSQKQFTLRIWTGTNEPQQLIYESNVLLPIYEDELNKFHEYHLDTTLVLSGTFFVGWRQTTSDNLNIGYDRNTNANENIFYNVSGTWMNSMYDGSLMIRPVFGKFFNVSAQNLAKQEQTITLYPNPNSGQLNFGTGTDDSFNFASYTLRIMDISGRTVFETPFAKTISLPETIENGLYFYILSGSTMSTPATSGKFILLR